MNNELTQAMEDFITQRINWHGQHEPDEVNEAYMDLRENVRQLREALTSDAQKSILRACEGSYHIADGEAVRRAYKNGFGDAIGFLFQFRDGAGD